jgi:glyoxylase-like metal-dependent hydrolase (beta-lactamase superfamily II)
MKELQIESLVLGQMATNCYLVKNKTDGSMLIIDPASEPQRIALRIQEMGGRPVAVLLTHGHFDHIGAAQDMKEKYGIPIYALQQEEQVLADPVKNLSAMFGHGYGISADHLLKDGDNLQLAGCQIQVIYTPGHTIGSGCYYLPTEQVLFSGDTLFRCSVGRTDFPTGSAGQLHHSLHEKLLVLPEETTVFPGHDAATDIRYEKMFNPY